MIDLKEFEEWVDLYSDQLTAFALKRTGNTDLAFDLVQDTFIAAYNNRDSFEKKGKSISWLYTILRNKIIDYYRKASYQKEESLDDSENEDALFFTEEGKWQSGATPGKWGRDAHSQLERSQFLEFLWSCKDQLPVKQKLAFFFKYFEDWSSDQICKELDVSSSNYWVLIHRAKLKLRNCLEKTGVI